MSSLCVVAHFETSPVDSLVVRHMLQASPFPGEMRDERFAGDCLGFAWQSPLVDELPEQGIQLGVDLAHGIYVLADIELFRRDEIMGGLAEELAEALVDSGGCRRSDADLLIAAYLQWGFEFVEQLQGEFAFVLWDDRKRRLLAARDPLGARSLHFASFENGVCFATEAQQIVRHPGVPKEIDLVSVGDFLLDETRDQERSFFRRVRRIAAGHFLVGEAGTVTTKRYWNPRDAPSVRYRNVDDYAENLLEILGRSVTDRLGDSSPTIGVAMSGGVDSCSIAALCLEGFQQLGSQQRLVAFSYQFKMLPDCDEHPFSTATARHLGIDLHWVQPEQFPLLFEDDLPESDFESPFLAWEGTEAQMYRRLKNLGGRLLLTGHGGDSLFQGSIRIFLSQLRQGRLGALAQMNRYRKERHLGLGRGIYRYLFRSILPASLDRTLRTLSGREPDFSVPNWIDRRFAHRIDLEARIQRPWRSGASIRDLARAEVIDTITNLQSVERACTWRRRRATAAGLKVRNPFLDARVAEYAAAVPPELHFQGGLRKALLRKALGSRLPSMVLQRADKTRFGPYIDMSLRVAARDRVEALLKKPLAVDFGILDERGLRDSLDSYLSGKNPEFSVNLWFVVSLEKWLRQFWSGSRT